MLRYKSARLWSLFGPQKLILSAYIISSLQENICIQNGLVRSDHSKDRWFESTSYWVRPDIASHCLRSKEFKTYFLALKVTTYHVLLVILLNISFFVWGVCTTCNTHLQWQHNWPWEGRVFGPSHSGLWHISSWILRQLPERERKSWRQGNFALHTFPLDFRIDLPL